MFEWTGIIRLGNIAQKPKKALVFGRNYYFIKQSFIKQSFQYLYSQWQE